jgi:hypothetical protein
MARRSPRCLPGGVASSPHWADWRIVRFSVTKHPTARWTAQQVVEAFPWEATPRYLLRDRDAVYGPAFKARVESLASKK